MPDFSFSHPRYQAGDLLGVGAQGAVFRVVDREAPERSLVAKLWHPGVFGEDVLTGEFALLARLRIPGLVRAHDLGRDAQTDAPFLVEDFVEGPEVGDWLREVEGAERGRRLSELLFQLTTTLAALHEAGFFHGDLKPAHVRFSPGGQATLLDLGAAIPRARREEGAPGLSPAFAAPEILAGAALSVASEFYSLGALAWCVAVGHPPGEGHPGLRSRAPWVPPAVADLVEALLQKHPGDRPATPEALLRRLGPALRERPVAPLLLGREEELRALLAPTSSPVRYLVGAAGIGKSLLASEVFTRALLAGRPARRIVLPEEGTSLLPGLLAYLRGAEDAYPFGEEGRPERPLLLVLDGLHQGPRELLEALELFRCRRFQDRMEVLAVHRIAPEGAGVVELGPLSDAELLRLAGPPSAFCTDPPGCVQAARGNPGWLLASLGGVPQDEDALRARLVGCSEVAWNLYTATILVGGRLEERWGRALAGEQAPGAFGWLLERGLLGRIRGGYLLQGSPDERSLVGAPVARIEEILLGDEEASPRSLLELARRGGDARRLFEEAARRARRDGRRDEELEALLGLCSRGEWRSSAALCRLEQLARDTGQAATHPQVLDWLEEAAQVDRGLLPLALRRRAEQQARAGNAAQAEELARSAVREARSLHLVEGEAYALATVGLVELFRASWVSAYQALKDARQRLAALPTIEDPEEAARLDHNLGVVAVYRGQTIEAIAAFQRALRAKERLGDRAGMRACLRNLGYALTRDGRLDEAARALDDALLLARSLGQAAGQAWCLVARAEVEVRRGAVEQAERYLAEAETFGSRIAAAVRADIWLLRAELRLTLGDGPGAGALIASIPQDFRQQDALVDATALTLEARSLLARIPAAPRAAARLAISAIRRARSSALPEPERRALVALRQARGTRERLPPSPVWDHPPESMQEEQDAPLWGWIESLGAATEQDAALALGRLILARSGAERVFLLLLDEGAAPVRGWAVDLDGFPLENAEKRAPQEALRAALEQDQPLYQRHLSTAGGQGCRLTLAGAPRLGLRPVLLLEHRFLPGRFDSIPPSLLGRWRALLALLARLGSAVAPQGAPAPSMVTNLPASPRSDAPPTATTLQPRTEPRRLFPSLVGQSEVWRQALARLDLAIDSDLPVLIVGETGVGKELFARALHEHGARAAGPFVAVNCAALPDALFEAELFGHAKGAFTGAERARVGLLPSADGGTLFLDEIGELSLPRQASLLRVLQERTYRPVGGDQERPVRVRIIAATNRDLEQAVEQGSFRQDLLYRLDVLRIRIPPLRERSGDIRALLRHFLDGIGSKASLSQAALAALTAHSWPGNVRELEHLAQRLAALQLPRIELAHLPRGFRGATAPSAQEDAADERTDESLPVDERSEVLQALERCGGNISHAARALGLTRHGLKKRMLRLGLRERAAPPSKP